MHMVYIRIYNILKVKVKGELKMLYKFFFMKIQNHISFFMKKYLLIKVLMYV